jgi:hypothetical protein
MSNDKTMRMLRRLPRQKGLVASEPQPRRSTRHMSGLRIDISVLLPRQESRPTRHDLQGIYTKGIDIDLPDGVDDVLGCVETLQPMTPH